MSDFQPPVVFLDLEQTLIDTWQDQNLIARQINAIRVFLRANKVTEVSIFSFAVWDNDDRQEFMSGLRNRLELALDVKIVRCPTIQDMMRADYEYTGVKFDHNEMADWISIRGKTDSFRNYVLNSKEEGNTFILIDDVVPNVNTTYEDTKLTVRAVNVDTLTKRHAEWVDSITRIVKGNEDE